MMKNIDELRVIIACALAEDVGKGDITSSLTIPRGTRAALQMVARETLCVSGAFVPVEVYRQLSEDVQVEVLAAEGEMVEKGAVLAIAHGYAKTLLTGERVALNLMQRMCGVATLTHAFVQAVVGTKARILDTRKTMPGLRAIDKYAVLCGGGYNHRMRLDDMVLIKDNHIALCGGITAAVSMARQELCSEHPLPLVVECDTLAQVREALAAKPDRILLDNMSLAELREAVALAGGAMPLEASGGISLENVREVALTGVDYISVGKITHGASAVDIGADVAFERL